MNISNIGPLSDLAGLLSGLQDRAQVTHAPKPVTPKLDQVRISPRAQEFQQAYQVVAQVPDVRDDKVVRLQEAIQSGTYNVRGEQVADKLITHTILDAIL